MAAFAVGAEVDIAVDIVEDGAVVAAAVEIAVVVVDVAEIAVDVVDTDLDIAKNRFSK